MIAPRDASYINLGSTKMTLQEEMQSLVNKYGICHVLNALSDEAARMVLCSYCPEAVKILDVLRACQEELCDQSMT